MHIKKGDKVKIIAGKDRGKTGTVLKVYKDEGKVSVEGVNLYKKRAKSKRQGQKGETVQVVRPLSISNVMFVCRNCGRATRVGYRLEGNQKVQYCKKCRAST
jgi:large subunit ribosomal protein L24